MTKEKKVIEIFTKKISNNYTWDGNLDKAMKISYVKRAAKKINNLNITFYKTFTPIIKFNKYFG